MKYLTLAIIAGLAALTGCATGADEDEAQSESSDAARAPGASSSGSFAREGDSCRLVINEGFDRHTGP